MKKNYFKSLILGIICLTFGLSHSQNILTDGDFSLTTEIIPFDTPTPPSNVWAYWVNFYGNGSDANPMVVDEVCNFQIINAGFNTWDIQLAQWGFSLIQGHAYRLIFDVKADANRSFGVFLGEDGGNYTSLIGYNQYSQNATTEWQTYSLDFEAFAIFPLHKLSFELGTDNTTIYFDNVILQDLGPTPPDKIVIAGTFQDELGCYSDWDPNCEFTELTLNSSSGLYTGTFQIPEGKNRYKVTVGGSLDINYGENGLINGPDIFLCLPSGSEEITFIYNPSTNLVTTSPIASGFSPDCLPLVVLVGSFQDELGCYFDWVPDCTNTELIYNSGSGLFETDLNIPSGCYEYRVVIENSWENSFGLEGIHNGPNYIIFIPTNPDITHFTYDPVSHIISSTPYSGAPQEVTKVSLMGTLQDELGCAYDYDYECDSPALLFNPDSNVWEGSFTLPAGCYTYQVKETFGCNNVTFYGESGIEWGNDIQLYVPSDDEITFSYDPQTHILTSTPYSGAPQGVTKVSLYGTLQNELGCAYDYDYECESPALLLNPGSGIWEGSFTLPAGCYTYSVKETVGCNNIFFYGENGIEWGNDIQLYVLSDGEITFSYDPQTHILTSTPYSGAPQGVTKVSLYGTLQNELGCIYDYDYECENPALVYNTNSSLWEGSFTLPAGCYTYWVKETVGCNNIFFYGENGTEWGNELQLYIPADGEITFSYDAQTHILTSTPYTDISTLNQCPNTITVNNSPGICGAIVNYPEFVTTANCGGEILSITQTEGLPSGSLFPIGITTNSFLLSKTTGDEITCSFDIIVFDTEQPVIADLNEIYEPLWPANHKMVQVFIEYVVMDNCGNTTTELYVTSNEAENGLGDGDKAPDWEILDEHNVLLRAERSGKGDGREYYITIMAYDDSGNYSERQVIVKVPHDQAVIKEFNNSNIKNKGFILYPNGVDRVINIKGLEFSENASYDIYNMFGEVKENGILKNNKIDVRTLPQGIYILKFKTEEGDFFKKFIKN